MLPTERIDWPLLMRREHLTCALIELMQITPPPSRSDGVFHCPPEACNGIEVVTTVGREQMQLQFPLVVVEGRFELVRPMDATAIGHHHHVFPGVPKDAHHLMDVLAKFLRIEMRHDFVEDARGAILHGANDIEQDPAGDTTPGAVLLPRLAFESLLVFDLIWTQGTCRQAIALGASPPARPEHGKAPQDGLIFIEENDLAPAGPIL